MFRRCKIMKKGNTIFEGELKKWMILLCLKMHITENERLTFLQGLKKSGRNIEVYFLQLLPFYRVFTLFSNCSRLPRAPFLMRAR